MFWFVQSYNNLRCWLVSFVQSYLTYYLRIIMIRIVYYTSATYLRIIRIDFKQPWLKPNLYIFEFIKLTFSSQVGRPNLLNLWSVLNFSKQCIFIFIKKSWSVLSNTNSNNYPTTQFANYMQVKARYHNPPAYDIKIRRKYINLNRQILIFQLDFK